MSLTSQRSKVNSSKINEATSSWVYSFGNGKAAGSAEMRNLLGGKGGSEAGNCGMPSAIIIAALDALLPLGVKDISIPATPQKVWRAIQDAREAIPSQLKDNP